MTVVDGDFAAFSAVIRGRVQGVGFRWSACEEASRLGVTGWVRNAENGSVEVLAEGRKTALAAFELWLKKGPPSSRVEDVLIRQCPPSGTFHRFSVDY